MASAAQTLANQANALHSTGPKSPEGKARAARNNTRHGLTLGVLVIEDHEKEAHAVLAAELREQVCPGSNLEYLGDVPGRPRHFFTEPLELLHRRVMALRHMSKVFFCDIRHVP